MKKIYLTLCSAVLFAVGANAQLNYTFSALNGTYTALSGGTSPTLTAIFSGVAASDEGYANNISIGFPFVYNGTSYSSLHICSNGFVSLGSAFTNAVNGAYTNFLSIGPVDASNTALPAQRPVIAPLWDDLDVQAASNIKYQLTGTSPNQVFTVQWSNVKWDYAGSAAISFQLKLYQTTNVIEFVYSQLAGAVSTTSDGASIGLSTASTGGNLASFMSVWDTNSVATASKIVENNGIIAKPATGRIYRFTPASIANDMAAINLYTLGAAPTTNSAQSTSVLVGNIGSTNLFNVPVTLNITGANTYTNTQTISYIPAGGFASAVFPAYLPTNIGNNTVTVSLPSDNDNTNNTLSLPQQSAVDDIAYGHYFSPASPGLNSGGDSFEIMAKISNTGTKYLNAFGFIIPSAAQPVQIEVYSAFNGSPSALLYATTSVTPPTGGVIYTLPANWTVTGDFFIGLKQPGTVSMNLGFEPETYNRTGVFFFKSSTGSWTDFSTPGSNIGALPIFELLYGNFPLPVSLVNFTGKHINDWNALSWTTENESGNKGFEVERSADGEQFETIGFVTSKAKDGNSVEANYYTYNDEHPLAGDNYYRLKQKDLKGKITYSNVVTLKANSNTTVAIAQLAPNPADKFIRVTFGAVYEKTNVQVTDLTGKIIAEQNVTNTGSAQLDISAAAPGIYLVKIMNDNGMSTMRFIKK